MEARQIKLESDFIPNSAELQDEQRIKAIRKILLGNQIERLESRFSGLSAKVDESNGEMLQSMNELKNQLNMIRSGLNLKENTNAHSQSQTQSSSISELEKALGKLSGARKESTFTSYQTKSELEKSLEPLNPYKSDNIDNQPEERELSANYSLNDFNEKLANSVNLEGNKLFLEKRLSDLEDKINKLSTHSATEVEDRLSQRQNRFENETHDLFERLASRVNERFDFAQNERDALEHRVSAIQDILENDILAYLKKGGGSVQGYSIEKMKSEMERNMREQQIRMEAKMEAFMDFNQRQMGRNQEDPKKKALRETLKRLSDLLDE